MGEAALVSLQNTSTSSNNTLGVLPGPSPFNFSCEHGPIPSDEQLQGMFQSVCGCQIVSSTLLVTPMVENFFNKFFLSISVIGNLLVILILHRMRRGFFNSAMKVLLQNLSVADTAVCVLYNINEAIGRNSHFTLDSTCKLFTGLLWASLCCSSCSVCCVSIERYLAVVHPLEFNLTKRKAFLMAIFSWYYSLLFTFPDFYFVERVDLNACTRGTVHLCLYSHWQGTDVIMMNLLNVTATFVVPLAVVLFTNISIMKILLFPNENTKQVQKSGDRRNRHSNVVIIVLLLTAIYVACSIPFAVYYVLTVIPQKVELPKKFPQVAYYLMLANSSCNPFVYSFFSADFRRECVRFLLTPYRWFKEHFLK
ncbi:predicted protein [Nematostella vectensis]|uniref:G-protein coupled receptors family 1 profile domain-containing protein n=1 Tax=Nematostella vectensis TaxID=45351 RepID=A7SBP0_NEMVE|nr:predicted protein [Nematostella vectensis]|eukprot:XP_001630939.1 predicted protein [Nematostella vectensis]